MSVRLVTTDQDIARFLGIDLKNRFVTGFTLRVRRDHLPTVVIHEIIDRVQAEEQVKRYVLMEAIPAKSPVDQLLPSSPKKEGGPL